MNAPLYLAPIARGRNVFARLHFRTLEERVFQVNDCEVYQVEEEPRIPPFYPARPDDILRVRVLDLRLQERHMLCDGVTYQWTPLQLAMAGFPEWATVKAVSCPQGDRSLISWREYHEEPPVGWWAKRRDLKARSKAIRHRIQMLYGRRRAEVNLWAGESR